ncbi:hypothetical protein C8N26_1052 [Tenacibaculum lutimaris]|uniref:MG2 domain-containing protein n=1 Tax=Tenacibaculum lutimaris TaxID=285258 RepID=A0A420E2L6_9FLAO|nr:hypothetical protein [Tenacibaculum lutimaris]RKF04384.1 hypothetical protein C8N26_1052 [Tenacibaculum lutimaris]
MKKTLFLLLFVASNLLFSQKNITESYSNYFENTREVAFLHLDKTTFLQGEEIWFKAYIQEQNSQKLHKTTSNLYVSVFEESGKLKEQQLIHIKDGIGNGSISIDSTYTEKNYYLKASTRWMKNFKEDNAYHQKVHIISSQQRATMVSEENSYEFELFPEGGNLIANTNNNIGILLKDSKGKGIKIKKGIIKDQNGNIIRYFNTNANGMNKVSLFIEKNMTYTFSTVLYNGLKIKATTGNPSSYGITINTIHTDKKIGINIITNDSSLKALIKKEFKVIIHNTRSYKTYNFTFKKNKKNYLLIFKRDDLNPGINIVTLFDEKSIPVSERIIFNNKDSLISDLRVKTENSSGDSLKIDLYNESNSKLFLSASFLPSGTEAYSPENTIISSFLLKPYVKGHVQNPGNYFKNLTDKKKLRDLDLLLLTQGWSKYNWTDIFNNSQKINYPFEHGIDVTMSFNKPIRNNQSILLYSAENNLITTFKPIENKWILKNTFIKKNSLLQFAVKHKENYLSEIIPTLSFSSGKLSDFINKESKVLTSSISEATVLDFEIIKDKFEVLNEVEVKAKIKKNEINKEYIEAGAYRNLNMKNVIVNSGETVMDFINWKTPPSRGISTIKLNGKNISREPWMLENMNLDQVKSIYYGSDMSNPGLSYAFFIFTYSPIELHSKKSTTAEVKTLMGFTIEKEYYNPRYPSYFNDTYKKYGAIFWEPNIEIGPKSSYVFKVPLNLQEKIIAYIEGVSESGELISKEYVLSEEKNK